MPISERSNMRSRASRTSSRSHSRATRSQIFTQKNFSNASSSSLPLRASTSLSGLPTPPLEFAVRREERLERWKARASSSTQSQNCSTTVTSTDNAVPQSGVNRHSYCKPTRASMLRSKSCPVPLAQPDYNMLYRKQKMFDLKCKTLSTSMSSHSLPNGETLHEFLIGARYNSGFTLDSHSLERHGIHIPKRNREMILLNSTRKKRPSPRVFGGTFSVEGSHTLLEEDHPRKCCSEQEIGEKGQRNGSSCSIEQQLDEVFGPNEEGDSSNTTIASGCKDTEEPEVSGDDGGITNVAMPTNVPTPLAMATSNMSEFTKVQTREVDTQESLTEESVSHSSLVLEAKQEENEQDFISHEALELTQEILKEFQSSSSSFSSSHSTHSTFVEPASQKNVVDRSLQTSFENLSMADDKGETKLRRPVSAGVTRGRPSGNMEARPKSAGVTRDWPAVEVEERPKSAIFVDMTNLQAPADNEDI